MPFFLRPPRRTNALRPSEKLTNYFPWRDYWIRLSHHLDSSLRITQTWLDARVNWENAGFDAAQPPFNLKPPKPRLTESRAIA